jgi:hypothetical protein
MDFVSITSNDAWFKKHPDKIAGVEVETTSFLFPIQVKGTKEDVLRVTGISSQKNTNTDQLKVKLAKAKAKAILIQLELE